MFGLPGKKLLFMGGEFGQWNEWYHEASLDWHLLDSAPHRELLRLVRDLNTFYRGAPALYETDCDPAGFAWIDCNDAEQSTLSFLRTTHDQREQVAVVCNFTPVPRANYRIGVPQPGFWAEVLNTDAPLYGGSGQGNLGGVETVPIPAHGHAQSIVLTLPPLAVLFFRGPAQLPAEAPTPASAAPG
jgi:1,4-alpha-glucan branching enzyme